MLTAEELKALDDRIRANADRLIAAAQKKVFTPSGRKGGRQLASFENCVRQEFQSVRFEDEENWPLWIDDPISGVARLNWYKPEGDQRPLSTRKIADCFALLDTIDAGTVSALLMVDKRQAQRYFKACEILHEILIDNYCTDEIRCMAYPATFIFPKRNECPDLQINQEEE